MGRDKPKITKIDTAYDGSILIFWNNFKWKNAETEILTCVTTNGDFRPIGKTTHQSFRIKDPKNVEYIKLIVKNDTGEVYITDAEKVNGR